MDQLLSSSAFSATVTGPDQILLKLDPSSGLTFNPDTQVNLSVDPVPPFTVSAEPAMSTSMSVGIGLAIGVSVAALTVVGAVWWTRRTARKATEAGVAAASPAKPSTVPPAAAMAA